MRTILGYILYEEMQQLNTLMIICLFYSRAGYATRKCRPVTDIVRPASELDYTEIKKAWYYKYTRRPDILMDNRPRNNYLFSFLQEKLNRTSRVGIITLEDWLLHFVGITPRSKYYNLLKLLWLDVKVSMDRYFHMRC